MGEVVTLPQPINRASQREALMKDLREKNPGKRLELFPFSGGDMVFAQPTPDQHQIFRKGLLTEGLGQTSADAYQNLAVMTCVYPDNATVQRMFVDWPGLPMNAKLVRALNKLAGIVDDEEAK
jgi:hypothetical protein